METTTQQEQESIVHTREPLIATLETNLGRIRSEERAYYDTARDEEDIKNYYAGIPPMKRTAKPYSSNSPSC